MTSPEVLGGLRILIVEDNFMVADSLKELMTAYGASVAAMVPSAAAALAAIEGQRIDVAILDIDLKDGKVDPLADRLIEHGIPFLFLTGFGDDSMLPPRLRGMPRLDKPVESERLIEELLALLAPKLRG
jgi:CheY-like chemotaxis protein